MIKAKNKKTFFTTKWITTTALLTALVIATSFIPSVPVTLNGNLYWCDCIIFLAAYLLDPLASFIVGGIGTLLYDVIKGNGYMMFASLIIHGLQAAATSAILHFIFAKFPKKLEPVWALIASIVGGAIVILGYFIQRYYILHTEWIYIGDKAIANLIQEVVGISIAMVICYGTTFKKQLERQHLLPDFIREVLTKKNIVETAETESDTVLPE
ncbi:MAG: ECF transporter S component [Clostridia bacterium]|nr:ECF transporter S component [Clostridia bacterium]